MISVLCQLAIRALRVVLGAPRGLGGELTLPRHNQEEHSWVHPGHDVCSGQLATVVLSDYWGHKWNDRCRDADPGPIQQECYRRDKVNRYCRDPEQTEVRVLRRQVPLAGAHVLEIGCGDGRLTRRIARLARAVVATDPDASLIARAKRSTPASLRESPISGRGCRKPTIPRSAL